jgi:hypothetical protein
MSETAQIILNQLGGNRIFAMAFQAPALTTENSVTLRVAPALRRLTREKPTHVVVRLEANDTYTVEVHRAEKPTSRRDSEVISYQEMVYADNLKQHVEAATGLRLSL